MTWGHASSADMVKWKHEPIAINPTKGGSDASGCWSGTTVLDTAGTPTMIYTGVRSDTLWFVLLKISINSKPFQGTPLYSHHACSAQTCQALQGTFNIA